MRAPVFLICSVCLLLAEEDLAQRSGPWIHRVDPLGGTRGTSVTVELIGEHLGRPDSVWFDTTDLRWMETLEASAARVRGRVAIASDAALGPHLMHLRMPQGRTNTRLFNVLQFPTLAEAEPNDPPGPPQEIELRPQVIQGFLAARRDIDVFRFTAKAGERWTFDLRSIEYGSHLECEMSLTDDDGREVAFNDDRDDYVETPFLDHTFSRNGIYRLKLDQYRGPQRIACEQNCGYLLQISHLPLVLAADPLGIQPGAVTRVRVLGKHLASAREAWLSPVRAGETYRLTFPFTVPLPIGPDRSAHEAPRVNARLLRRSDSELELDVPMPVDAPEGLWRLWVGTPDGITEGVSIEASKIPAVDESQAESLQAELLSVINGRLRRQAEEDSYWIQAKAGRPIHAWTLATQLGLPHIDTVLELFDSHGKLLAESDDLMTGQGTVIGNPDSSLYFTPAASARLRLVVRDRTGRGGPDYVYRLKVASEVPGFRLVTEPEEFRGVRGQTTQLSVLLIPDPGFHEAVDTWIEGLPAGAQATSGQFRADQHFGPSGDGDNVNIPEVTLMIRVPSELSPGEYPIRVLGRRSSGGVAVEAFTTLWIGSQRKLYNDVRRPLPAVTMTVIDPPSVTQDTQRPTASQ